MIYPKFPQRYLAAIVFCLILTLAALGGIFLIYLFNGSPTPLLFTADTNAAIAKPPNYFYGNDDKFSSYQQNLLHKESQFQHESVESHSMKDELVTLDELAAATSGSISSEQHVPRSLKQQQKQRVANRRENYHRIISAASEPVLANSNELSLEHQQAMFSQQQKLQHQPQLLQPSSEITDSFEATAKYISSENNDDVKLVSALTSIESFQYQIPSSSNENSDAIYIDDFERQSSSGDIRIDETSGSDDVPRDTNMRINNFTDAVVEVNDTNPVLTTTSSSATAAAQNSSNINRFNYKAHSKQRNSKHRQQLTALVKKKRKQQRLLSKLQHKNANNNIAKLNSDKQLKHQLLQYSTQKVKKHLNFQHRENRFSVYDSNSSSSSSGGINDVDDIIVYSGSGDFNSNDNNDNDDSDDDYDIDADTANYIKRINMKMWRTMSNVAGNLNTQRKSKQQYKQHQQQLRQLQAFNNKQKKHRRLKQKQADDLNKQQNSRDLANNVDNFYSISSEIVSNLSAPQLNHEIDSLAPTVTSTEQDKDSFMRKSNVSSSSSSSNNNRINQISTVATRNTVAITNNSQWLFSPTYSVNNVTSSTSIQINNTFTPQLHQQQQQQLSSRVTDLAAAEPVVKSAASSGSAAWLETRTRRIMGNVKKSEERSRQLLLCEEAGGGELCRMLFKGHLNE